MRWKFIFNCGAIKTILKWWSEIQRKVLIQDVKIHLLGKKIQKTKLSYLVFIYKEFELLSNSLFFSFPLKKKKNCSRYFFLGPMGMKKLQHSQWVLSTRYLLPLISGDSANLMYRSALICTWGFRNKWSDRREHWYVVGSCPDEKPNTATGYS